jgi:uroporphyrinogen decarboxylase
MINKTFAHMLLEKLLEYNLLYIDKYLDIFGDIIDVVKIADDISMQNAPIISPELYREFIKGRQRQIIEHIKEESKVKVLLHSDGAINDFIPDFIEIGVDILQPLQVSASGMNDTKKIKKDFGMDLVFWGAGCDSQEILVKADSKKVKEETRRRIEDLAPGGGYVFGPIHNIQPGTPPENIITMFETAFEYGN